MQNASVILTERNWNLHEIPDLAASRKAASRLVPDLNARKHDSGGTRLDTPTRRFLEAWVSSSE